MKQKILGKGESVDGWREVTDREKQTLEAQDAAWVEPPQAFIESFDVAAGMYGGYNRATGYFELNELYDITYEQAMLIMAEGKTRYPNPSMIGRKCRTNMLYDYWASAWYGNFKTAFTHIATGTNCETLRIAGDNVSITVPNTTGEFVWYAFNLKKILGKLSLADWTTEIRIFNVVPKLEDVRLFNLKADIAFRLSSNLSFDTLDYLVEQAVNTSEITITVHPDVYAKLNDEGNAEWFELMQRAAAKQIAFATA